MKKTSAPVSFNDALNADDHKSDHGKTSSTAHNCAWRNQDITLMFHRIHLTMYKYCTCTYYSVGIMKELTPHVQESFLGGHLMGCVVGGNAGLKCGNYFSDLFSLLLCQTQTDSVCHGCKEPKLKLFSSSPETDP